MPVRFSMPKRYIQTIFVDVDRGAVSLFRGSRPPFDLLQPPPLQDGDSLQGREHLEGFVSQHGWGMRSIFPAISSMR